jgi:hypothetical protein
LGFLIVNTTFFIQFDDRDHEYTSDDWTGGEIGSEQAVVKSEDSVEEEGWFETILVLWEKP